VRRADPDRYFSALFAPAGKRHALLALYAFNVELSRIGETVHEPMLGEIRLQWWRETMEGVRTGKPRRHDVAEAMAQIEGVADLPDTLFEKMIDARSFDVSREGFVDEAALENYLRDTSGVLMQLAARLLGATTQFDGALADAGTAFGLAGAARALAFHAQRGKILAPETVLKRLGISADRLASVEGREAFAAIAREMGARALTLYDRARSVLGRNAPLVALLPASLVPLYARSIARTSWDPFDPDVGAHRRLVALLVAATLGRI
jgi:phytoene synthase